ncbi:MAG: helix-turn-helix domain-containing protein [Telluria sp.]
MVDSKLTIGALSSHTHCTVPTIRYYEQIGLLPRPQRASNGHRFYRDDDLKRLSFIKRCRDFGFPIEQVRELVGLLDDGERACVEVRDLAQVHLDQVRAKLEQMRQLEASLEAFVCRCNAACNGGPTRDCVILDEMASPGACTSSCAPTDSCGNTALPQVAAAPFAATELRRS